MNKVLDCSTTKSAIQSTAAILKIDSDKLGEILQNIGSIPRIEEPKAYIIEKVYSIISRPMIPVPSIWFHATRVINQDSFLDEGIQPKAKMYPKLRDLLEKLSLGMKSFGCYPNSSSADAKEFINDEGPFAFLFRSVAVNAPGCTHAYYESPELVEDIAGSLLGANYAELVKKYTAVTRPCIITFRAKAEDWAFNSALWHAYLINYGYNDLDAADIANTCFDGKGMRIPPADIINVEILD
jgi:hypothetical protein